MSLLGTLTKVAIGYAAAKGVSHMAGGKGLQGIMEQVQKTMGSLQNGANGTASASPFDVFGDAGSKMQDMMSGMMGADATSGSSGGLLDAMKSSQAGSGLAGMLAAASGMVASGQAKAQETMEAFGGAPINQEVEAQSGLMLRAMFQAIKADGKIDEAEQARIMEFLGDDATEADTTFLRTQLAAPIDVESLAGDTPAHLAPQVYAASLMTIKVDTDAERAYLADLAAALGLQDATVAALHAQMGVSPL